MSLGNVDYWRTFRDFESNASIIADQAQDVVTFQGGDNITLSFNEGDDIITWHADLQSITNDVTANISVINEAPRELSMLEYDPALATFTSGVVICTATGIAALALGTGLNLVK